MHYYYSISQQVLRSSIACALDESHAASIAYRRNFETRQKCKSNLKCRRDVTGEAEGESAVSARILFSKIPLVNNSRVSIMSPIRSLNKLRDSVERTPFVMTRLRQSAARKGANERPPRYGGDHPFARMILR
jgi:hypothetical protein